MTDQISRADIDAALAEAKRQIADNGGWFLAIGLLLIVAGGILSEPGASFTFHDRSKALRSETILP